MKYFDIVINIFWRALDSEIQQKFVLGSKKLYFQEYFINTVYNF